MTARVVDTNVLGTANRAASQASPQCVLACVKQLRDVEGEGTLVLDDGWRVIKEYQQLASSNGQPGVGDAFLKWVLTNHANPARCELVRLTPDAITGFAEFPNDPALGSFDPPDRKFVALALASRHRPPIVNATDTDWWHHRDALKRNGVDVIFLCPELMTRGRGSGATA